ncbi:MAG: malonyl-CoA decarboxylase family protein [Caulobacteraceae bacterium]|nr:malonyl-CoA decarboxylase family protein [Caulobacteraceae bacterium]
MSEPVSTGLLDRAIRRIAGVWREMAASVAGDETVRAQMKACLDGRGGEVSARNRAAKLAQTFLSLDEAGRADFLRVLAEFDSDPAAVAAAFAKVEAAAGPAERAGAKVELRRTLEPPRVRLLTQFASIPDGCKFLVDLRGTLLKLRGADKALAALDADLKGLLAAWFDVGFLELRRIDWESPAALLEKLVDYEAVHAIRSWRDLKNRLDSDRRCYAFFHPRMPGEPLIFVEVALVKGLAGNVQALLDEAAPVLDPRGADTAIFYSISNCQAGLAGISFGNFLIKRVVEELSDDFRNLKTFATLSPIPGFRRWLDPLLAAGGRGLLFEDEQAALVQAMPSENGPAALAAILGRKRWWREAHLRKAAEPALLRLAARYLVTEGEGARARDSVAHFHLSNGARIERLALCADTSDKGAKESATLMVNYLYDLAKIEAWHEDYAGEGRRNASPGVRKLLKRSAAVKEPAEVGLG